MHDKRGVMENKLYLYNTLTRKRELFVPLFEPYVGMYACGPTVYGEPHLGHARQSVTFDLIFRYLLHLGYKVRYVRNITDVGHLEDEGIGEGEDKIAKKARLENLEPMEVAQFYLNKISTCLVKLNVKPPSIEPRASGHIIEQIEMIKKILEKGYAYEINGSVYFNVEKYNRKYNYGKLSGRVVEDLLAKTRTLEGQDEKKNAYDFALWKKAAPEHIMRWPSPWSDGFPGWHLECSAMGKKYLGDHFDIHGGGLDLLFPHHECEIAQSVIANGKDPVKYWLHNNMITIEGKKMGKSLNNTISLEDIFTGNHTALEKNYSPMAIRFFILMAHYRSTLDFSNEALKAAEKGLKRLFKGIQTLNILPPSDKSTVDISELQDKCAEAMNDDFGSPVLIAHLFDGVKTINSIKDKKQSVSKKDLELLKEIYNEYVFDVLGLIEESTDKQNDIVDGLMETIIALRQSAKDKNDYDTADKIRYRLLKHNIIIKDTKEGVVWEIKEQT